MDDRYLGRTGLKVSELCLGAMTFGREADEETSHRILDRFAEAGGNFIDTADVYTRGASEEITGRWLRGKRRSDFVVATKVRFPMGEGPNDVGLSRQHILTGVEASLRRLGTDTIDLYQVHCWDQATPLEETLSTLDALVRSGKVRYVGASNFTGWQLQKAVDLSRWHGWRSSSACSRSTTCWIVTSSGTSCRYAATRGWASSPGPAAWRLAERQVPPRHGRAAGEYPHRRGREGRVE